MGLLNRKTAAASSAQTTGVGGILSALTPPYKLNDFLMLLLNQMSEWLPGDGYYAYVAESDQSELTLKATRAAAGIATVGPNYAGLVLGGGIRTVALSMPVLSDDWAFYRDAEGLLTIGFGPKAAFRVAVNAKFRVSESVRERVQQWLREIAPLFDLLLLVEPQSAGSRQSLMVPEMRRSRQDLLLQIPHLMGLLADLGTGVLNSSDGYLALWADASSVELSWVVGLGREVSDRLDPIELYQVSRDYRIAVWDESRMPPPIVAMGFTSLLAIPLDSAAGTAGVLALAATQPIANSASLVETLGYLAESLKKSLDGQGASYAMAQNYLQALFTATKLLDEADPYNEGHHQQVAQLCARLAMKAGWPSRRVQVVEMAGRLHDLGMVTVALDVTREGGNLAEQTRSLIQQHPMAGSELLAGLPEAVLPSAVTRAVREHHERFDGLGYPAGLKGSDLSEEGRILACAEQFVARISPRSYRQGLSVGRALYEIERLSGHQLDPEVVTLLLDLYREAGVRPQAPT